MPDPPPAQLFDENWRSSSEEDQPNLTRKFAITCAVPPVTEFFWCSLVSCPQCSQKRGFMYSLALVRRGNDNEGIHALSRSIRASKMLSLHNFIYIKWVVSFSNFWRFVHLEIEISMNKLPKALANPKNSYVIDLHSLLGLSFFASYGAPILRVLCKNLSFAETGFLAKPGPIY